MTDLGDFLSCLPTNVPNPNIAVIFLSLLRQLDGPERGSILGQGSCWALCRSWVSLSVDVAIAVGAGSIARTAGERPGWLVVLRCWMGTVLAGLTVRMRPRRGAESD